MPITPSGNTWGGSACGPTGIPAFLNPEKMSILEIPMSTVLIQTAWADSKMIDWCSSQLSFFIKW
jgi:hypothetical protein